VAIAPASAPRKVRFKSICIALKVSREGVTKCAEIGNAGMEREKLLENAGGHGVNRVVFRVVRTFFLPFFRIYFRLSTLGREHVPKSGATIYACNHRSFLDPFVISALGRRPLYFVAKRELFEKNRLQTWFLNSLGAFPIDRGHGDNDSMETALRILARGDGVMIFVEGTRVRPGPLGHPRSGVGRLALQSGAPVVPVAVIGTENVRRGWKIYPRKVTVRAGAPLNFPHVEDPSHELAKSVAERVWPCVEMQWEWLGGTAPLRRVGIVGAGGWGTSLAVALARAGISVELGTRREEQAGEVAAARVNERYLPGVELDAAISIVEASKMDLQNVDAVLLAVPTRELPAVIGEMAPRLAAATGVVVTSKGLVPGSGELPTAYCAARIGERPIACLGGPGHAADALEHGASLVIAGGDKDFLAQLSRAFADANFDVTLTDDTTGVELAGVATNAAVLAATTASVAGPNAAGAAAGKVFSEVASYASGLGSKPASWTGLAGVGDLVASVVAAGGRNRRAGEMLAAGVSAQEIRPEIGQVAEALDSLPLLVEALKEAHVRAPAINALAEVVAGTSDAASFADSVLQPRRVVGARVV
jgi:1-acyl-sn-glycerol-3-phosphate acyltransferase